MTKEQIKSIIDQMTLEEKISFCSGHDAWHAEYVSRLGVPEIMMCDGPHGLRKRDKDENGEPKEATYAFLRDHDNMGGNFVLYYEDENG